MGARQKSIAQERPAKPKRRIFLWFFLAVQVLFVIWIVTAIGSDDVTCEGLSKRACDDLNDVGTGIGVALIVGAWMVVDFLLAVIYGVYRLAKRT